MQSLARVCHPDLHAKYYSESASQDPPLLFPLCRNADFVVGRTTRDPGALEDKLANLTVEQRAALDKDLAKKEKKEEQKAEKEKAKQAVRCSVLATPSPPPRGLCRDRRPELTAAPARATNRPQSAKIIVKRMERNKKKYVTSCTACTTLTSTSRRRPSSLPTSLARARPCQRRPRGTRRS